MTDALWTAAEAAARLGRSRRTTVAVAERLSSSGDPGIQRVGHAWAATPAWWAQALGPVPRRAPRHVQGPPSCERHSGPSRPGGRGEAG
jgi:hypothetical protein